MSRYSVTFCLTLLACSSSTTPSDPVWGKQPCDHCHMLLSEPRTAAQLVTIRGDRRYFDDVGCLVEHLATHGAEVARAWVRDARGQWVEAQRANYRGAEATPMGYGFVVDERGSIDFARVQREVARRAP
ncbi:MAG TPA: hypothetical protein VJV78_38285 [Polyangiales bacterium]|nr:hypothetical protein [Polyangiales bacterium]